VLNPVVAGRIMIGVAIVGLLASLVGAVIGRQLVTDFDRGVEQSLILSAAVIETVDDSFEVADEALGLVTEGVIDAEAAVRSLGRSMGEGQEALDALTMLTGEDVADALESVEEALPAVEQAADSIDRTLGALSSLPLGLSYAPDRPLAESIGEIREGIEGLPDELRDQAEQAERTSDELAAATERTVATADALGELIERLEVAGELVGQYVDRTAEARDLVEDQREALSRSAGRARLLVVALSGVFALSQIVPLYLGLALTRGVIAVTPP
jgi:chromosome segregation ATPase